MYSEREVQDAWACVDAFIHAANELAQYGVAFVQARYGEIDPVFFEGLDVFREAMQEPD